MSVNVDHYIPFAKVYVVLCIGKTLSHYSMDKLVGVQEFQALFPPPSRERSLVLISVRDLIDPRAIVQPKIVGQ
jgi:hypothetical protein